MIKTIIFDFDGTMINSEKYFTQDELIFYQKKINKNITKKEWEENIGRSLEDTWKYYKSHKKMPLSKKEFFKNWNEWAKNIYLYKTKLLPNLLNTLKFLKKQNYKIAICSSAQIKLIKIILERFDLNKYFDTIISAEDLKGKPGKPKPHIYKIASKKTKTPPNECLVFEDSYNGIASAKDAGMLCIGVRNEVNKNVDFSLADKEIKNYKEVNQKFLKKINHNS